MNFAQHFLTRTNEWFSEWVHSLTDVDLDTDAEIAEVEFVGGPLDGHSETVIGEKLFQLPTILEMDVTADALVSLGRNDRAQQASLSRIGGRPTSTAFYDLAQRDCQWFYRFSHQQSTTDRTRETSSN